MTSTEQELISIGEECARRMRRLDPPAPSQAPVTRGAGPPGPDGTVRQQLAWGAVRLLSAAYPELRGQFDVVLKQRG